VGLFGLYPLALQDFKVSSESLVCSSMGHHLRSAHRGAPPTTR
jgi:hypothetical protein